MDALSGQDADAPPTADRPHPPPSGLRGVLRASLPGRSPRQRGRPTVHIPAYGSDEVADVTGAGDTVIATFTLALLAGADFVDAARLSNYAAGLVVMKAGTATVSVSELSDALDEDLAT